MKRVRESRDAEGGCNGRLEWGASMRLPTYYRNMTPAAGGPMNVPYFRLSLSGHRHTLLLHWTSGVYVPFVVWRIYRVQYSFHNAQVTDSHVPHVWPRHRKRWRNGAGPWLGFEKLLPPTLGCAAVERHNTDLLSTRWSRIAVVESRLPGSVIEINSRCTVLSKVLRSQRRVSLPPSGTSISLLLNLKLGNAQTPSIVFQR